MPRAATLQPYAIDNRYRDPELILSSEPDLPQPNDSRIDDILYAGTDANPSSDLGTDSNIPSSDWDSQPQLQVRNQGYGVTYVIESPTKPAGRKRGNGTSGEGTSRREKRQKSGRHVLPTQLSQETREEGPSVSRLRKSFRTSLGATLPGEEHLSPAEKVSARIAAAIEEGNDKVDLSNLGLETLPDSISDIQNLVPGNWVPVKLFLNENYLRELPPALCDCTNLSTLILSKNELTRLPAKIGRLTRLRELILRGNNLTCLPATLLDLDLESFSVHLNPMHPLPKEAEEHDDVPLPTPPRTQAPSSSQRTITVAPSRLIYIKKFRSGPREESEIARGNVPTLRELALRSLSQDPTWTKSQLAHLKPYSDPHPDAIPHWIPWLDDAIEAGTQDRRCDNPHCRKRFVRPFGRSLEWRRGVFGIDDVLCFERWFCGRGCFEKGGDGVSSTSPASSTTRRSTPPSQPPSSPPAQDSQFSPPYRP
ncbi:hypothetical protein G7K_4413-t1 [Saitoella complicata NRRL Y-17804]|uniref:Uncharacterized protein n=2 Tax=Saitoella complicata (strain BCRC 22490 / CBS 7301 / JCM 7358 / NBRC 10748 / NRRL Y-17804) TaxID=698492 RepID=A0A0E9NKE7_SAICN|nr:hypothetical protein G7K_4413-t1 [Saitoella complicata NRRL Y-17804]